METKHTPHTLGPWEYEKFPHDRLYDGERFSVYGQAYRSTHKVATVYRCYGESKRPDADALLVTAAPDMLAALIGCVEHMEWSTPQGKDAHSSAVAAIAKAKGE